MDALRKRQIHEILNYDKDLNLRVLALERKQVALMGPEGDETGVTMNQDVIDMASDALRWTNGELIFLLSLDGTTVEAIGCIGMQ